MNRAVPKERPVVRLFVVLVAALGLAGAACGNDGADGGFVPGDSADSLDSADGSDPPGSDGSDATDDAGRGADGDDGEGSQASADGTDDQAPDPKASAEEQIRILNDRDQELFVACTNDPSSCDPVTDFAELRTGARLDDVVELVTSWQADGRIARHPPDIDDNDFLRTESVTVADDLLTATATVCSRDGRAAYLSIGGEEYVILSETYGDEFTLAERSYIFQDQTWKLADTEVLAQSIMPEEPICDPQDG